MTTELSIPLYQVDAFAERPFAGNPAAVCLYEAWLPDETLQAIAAENNLSETAFLVPRGEDWELRWMTPRVEVDLCGHATLAAAHVLFTEVDPDCDEVRFHTKSGVLEVGRDEEYVVLDFPTRPAEPCEPSADLVRALGVEPRELYATGHSYVAVVDEERIVRDLAPAMHVLEGLERGSAMVTAPGDEVDFVSRFFAPALGIPEDPVTGSAHCTLTPYWARRLGKEHLDARQISPRGGALQCVDQGERTLIAGRAVLVARGELILPV